jgi:putative phosphonate metabolism protein
MQSPSDLGPRYAIYFTPAPQSTLRRIGAASLGYDAETQAACAYPDHALYRDPAFLGTLASPARYGFHATLKAPFELRSGATEHLLLERVATFCTQHAPVLLPALEVAFLDDFAALRPIAEDAGLNRLAAASVRDFDDLRAPPSDGDRARRLSTALTSRQLAHLDRWGYPYVFEDYRFHMTLTGAIPPAMRCRVLDALKAQYRRAEGPVAIDAISVMIQPTRADRFGLMARLPLTAVVPVIDFGR